jgi:hypothetical protein
MTNKEAIEHLKELKILRIEFPNALQEQALDLAIKVLQDATPIENITTKGGMTLSLKKTDIEISNLVRCIASVLKDITVEEFANKYNMLTVTDNNSGKSVSYCRVDGEKAKNE